MTAPAAQERAEIDRTVERLFTLDSAGRIQALRTLFVEKQDVEEQPGAIRMPAVKSIPMADAELIATREGVQEVYVSENWFTQPCARRRGWFSWFKYHSDRPAKAG